MLLKQKGDVEKAEEHLKEALRMEKSVYGGADHVEVAVTLHEYGRLLEQKGDLEQAEEHLKEAEDEKVRLWCRPCGLGRHFV